MGIPPRTSTRSWLIKHPIPLPMSMDGLSLADNANQHHAAVVTAWTSTVCTPVQHEDPLIETCRQNVMHDAAHQSVSLSGIT